MSETYPITVKARSFGSRWVLGYQWLGVTLGGSRPVTGLAIVAHYQVPGKPLETHRRIVFGIKEAMTFFSKHKVPPSYAGKLLAAATQEDDWD